MTEYVTTLHLVDIDKFVFWMAHGWEIVSDLYATPHAAHAVLMEKAA